MYSSAGVARCIKRKIGTVLENEAQRKSKDERTCRYGRFCTSIFYSLIFCYHALPFDNFSIIY